MKKCPYCGQAVADDVYHCPKCLAGIPHEEKRNEEKPVEAEEPKTVSRRKLRS